MKDWDCDGDTAVFRVGVGSSAEERRDAFRVMKTGHVYVNGEEVATVPMLTGIIGTNGRLGDGANRRLDDASAAHSDLEAKLEAANSKIDAANAKIAALEAKQAEMERMITSALNAARSDRPA